jgi:catechol 2,3-dioxygenase-like lactoylglutathione lyase family enzyme
MKVIGIAFSAYGVTDLKRSRRFYEDTLGLKPTKMYVKGDLGMIEYDIGPGTLAIGCGAPMFKPASAGGVVALEVKNFAAAVRRLKQNGVKCLSDPHETPVCHLLTIADPDGNLLIIHKRKPLPPV